jgi:indolepyruvate ferredoxin oxidoreductase beta subunit
MIVYDAAITPTGGSGYNASVMIDCLKSNVKKLIVIESNRLEKQSAGSFNPKTLNVALLGAAAQSGVFPFDVEMIKQVIPEILPERFWELNLASLETGRKILGE